MHYDNCIPQNYIFYTIHRERIFIAHKDTRDLLRRFSDKGLTGSEFQQLTSLVLLHAPWLSKVILHISSSSEKGTVVCAKEWCKLIHALSATSPACGLLHPSETTSNLVKEMIAGDITTKPHLMKCLQEQLPVMFELTRTLHGYPHELMKPIIEEMLLKANTPFEGDKMEEVTPVAINCNDEMSYFPHLPKCRERQVYTADTVGKVFTCTKKSSRHPTLLPGVFTLFCEHGKSMNV